MMLNNYDNAEKIFTKWLVVSTIPYKEVYACDHLVRQTFHVYCPMVTKRIKHARSIQDVRRPLFPGYVFVEHRPQLGTWRPILGTHGVKSVVRIGERPSLLCGSFIDGLKACETDGVICKPTAQLSVGQDVTVQGGPFDGFVARIIELREKDRVLVLLDYLNNQTKMHLRADMLTPV
jgi:transcriptional antiterminator RfaH